MHVLVTGAAGFIGFHLCHRLLDDGHTVTGFDGMTPYYDVALKRARLVQLTARNGFSFTQAMLEEDGALMRAAEGAPPDMIVHLAAQAGVRYSLENPRAYVDANLTGSYNVLELARQVQPRHLLLASTSSVYGANASIPFAETDRADEPMTLYAATKKAMETMGHSYAHLWRIPTTSFRFFTVYGPWGRPDMALFKFVAAMLKGEPIDIYGEGRMRRDFTYIDDLIEAICRLMAVVPGEDNRVPEIDSLSPVAPCRVVNLGGGRPVGLLDFVEVIEKKLGLTARRTLLPMQKGDVPETFARPDLLMALTGYVPQTPVDVGVSAFVDWYKSYSC